jgi:hypothetical protein
MFDGYLMRTLNNLGITPPGGFKWFCTDTKMWVPSTGGMPSYVDFINACKKHAQANNLPMGLLWEQNIQDQVCAGLDGSWCNIGGYPVPPPGGHGFTLQDVIQGNHMLAGKMIAARARRIPAEEASQRAAICLDCPYNQSPVGCSGCAQASLDAAENMVAGGGPSDMRLKSCKITGFSLKAKTNTPLEILRECVTENQIGALPERCWLHAN